MSLVSSQTAIHRPGNKALLILYHAAAAVVRGKTIGEGAREAGVSLNALKGYRHRYPTHWEWLLQEAERKLKKSEPAPPVILPASDPGLTSAAVAGIRAATALLAAGMTHEEVTKELKLQPTTIHHWQFSYPQFWRRCFNRAVIKDEAPAETATVELSPEITTSQFFTAYVKPICLDPKNTQPKTFKAYQNALKHWRQLSGDPPVNQIDDRTCAKFTKSLSQRLNGDGEKISPNTVRKICIHLQFVFDRLGPRNRQNRFGTNLLADSPYLQKPRRRIKPPTDNFSIKEISAWLEAAKCAQAPRIRGITPAEWWTALILFIYNTGLRIGTALKLRWSMLVGNFLTIDGSIYKGGDGRQFTLSDRALEAIRPLRELQSDYPKIFPWPYSESYLEKVRQKILKGSSIDETRQFGFHALRKALASELARVNPIIAQIAMGHTSIRTTAEHYINSESFVESLNKIPQPKY
jgi:integrase